MFTTKNLSTLLGCVIWLCVVLFVWHYLDKAVEPGVLGGSDKAWVHGSFIALCVTADIFFWVRNR